MTLLYAKFSDTIISKWKCILQKIHLHGTKHFNMDMNDKLEITAVIAFFWLWLCTSQKKEKKAGTITSYSSAYVSLGDRANTHFHFFTQQGVGFAYDLSAVAFSHNIVIWHKLFAKLAAMFCCVKMLLKVWHGGSRKVVTAESMESLEKRQVCFRSFLCILWSSSNDWCEHRAIKTKSQL